MVRPGVNSAGQSSKPGQSSSYTKAGGGTSASTTAISKAAVEAATAAQYAAAKQTVDAKIAANDAARAANRAAGITSATVSQGDKQSYEQKIKNAMTPLTTAQQATLEQQVGAAAIFARVNADYNKATGGSATVATNTYTIPNSGGAKVNLNTAEIIPPQKKIIVSETSYPIAEEETYRNEIKPIILTEPDRPMAIHTDATGIDQMNGSLKGVTASNLQLAQNYYELFYGGGAAAKATPAARTPQPVALRAVPSQQAQPSLSLPSTMSGLGGWLGQVLGLGVTARLSARRAK